MHDSPLALPEGDEVDVCDVHDCPLLYLKMMKLMFVMCMTVLLPSLSHSGPNIKEFRIMPSPL